MSSKVQGSERGSLEGADDSALLADRVYDDPSVPELLCRYPTEPTVTVLEQRAGELLVSLNGRPRRVLVRNPQEAEVGHEYFFIRDGPDRGLWKLID